MSTTDAKLYRIFVFAGEKSFASRIDMAREIAKFRFDEFSYEVEGEVRYHSAAQIAEYVNFAAMLGLLDGELQPYVHVQQLTRRGFDQALGEKVENFCEANGFSATKIKQAVRVLLIERSPSELPAPRTVHKLLKVNLSFHYFYKAVNVVAFQERTKLFVRSRATFLSPDTFKE